MSQKVAKFQFFRLHLITLFAKNWKRGEGGQKASPYTYGVKIKLPRNLFIIVIKALERTCQTENEYEYKMKIVQYISQTV